MLEVPYYTDESGNTRVKVGHQIETASGLIKFAGDIITLGKIEQVEQTLIEEAATDGE